MSMDPFLEACGAAGPFALDIEDRDGPEDVQRIFTQPFVLVGRDPQADLNLNHWQVSRRHAYLQMVAGRVFCLDLESRTGTRWGKVPGRAGWVSRRQTLRIGPFGIRVASGTTDADDHDELATPLAARSLDGQRLPEVALEFHNSETGSSTWQMGRVMALVGSASGCRPRLLHSSISRFHCTLLRTPVGLWIVDLFGREGVTVNGQTIRYLRLSNDDEVRIGRFVIRVRIGDLVDPDSGPESDPELDVPSPSAASQRRQRALPNATAPAGDPAGLLLPYSQARPPATLQGGAAEPWRPAANVANGSVAPLTPTHLAGSDPFLLQLASQFGAMQQQMLDQFQQAMMMMLQMFGDLHRDQIERARVELDELGRLTRELQTLQAESAREAVRSREHSAAQMPGVAPSAEGGIRGRADESPGLRAAKGPSANSPGPQPTRPDLAAARASATPDQRPPDAGRSAAGPQADDNQERNERQAPRPAVAQEGEFCGQDLHWKLTQRIAELQEERQSRWQRLFNLVAGGQRGEPTL